MINGFSKTSGLTTIQSVLGFMILVISLLALTGWLLDIRVLSSIRKEFIPMAPLTGFFFIPYGLFFLFGHHLLDVKHRKKVFVLFLILTIFAGLQFMEFFLHRDLTFDSLLFPSGEKLGRFNINRMSPYSGLLFFLCGISILLRLKSEYRHSILNVVADIGLFILLAAFVACLGYLFGTPFLYSGYITPIAATTAIAFFCMGFALITMAGDQTLILSHFVGESANARILRTLLPIVFMSILLEGFLNVTFVRYFKINFALLVAILSLLMVVFTFIIVVRIAKVIFRKANEDEIERKRAEEELLKFKLGIERSSEVVIMTNTDGNIVYVNPSFERTYGYSIEEVLGRNPRFLKSGTLSDSFYQEFWKILLDKRLVVSEIVNKTKDGILLNIETSVNPILNESKNIIGYIAVQHNITERKQAELSLLDYSEKLKISNETKDRLFNIIAHDLKSPFNSILGFSQILMNEYDLYSDKEKKSFIRKINDSSETAFMLLDNLLIWSRTQTGGIKANPVDLKLAETVRLQVDALKNVAESKQITISVLVSQTAIAYADKDMIKTVLLNLLNNAIKFTPIGGHINVQVRNLDKRIEISIADSGVGISKENLEKLFKVNVTQSTIGTKGEKGTGLGLIICKEFVEKNGGEFRVESKEGSGSMFSFTLSRKASEIEVGA